MQRLCRRTNIKNVVTLNMVGSFYDKPIWLYIGSLFLTQREQNNLKLLSRRHSKNLCLKINLNFLPSRMVQIDGMSPINIKKYFFLPCIYF
jgi:hypothetical protein